MGAALVVHGGSHEVFELLLRQVRRGVGIGCNAFMVDAFHFRLVLPESCCWGGGADTSRAASLCVSLAVRLGVVLPKTAAQFFPLGQLVRVRSTCGREQ